MLKHIKVPIIIDDHEPEKCGISCTFYYSDDNYCSLFAKFTNYNNINNNRCRQCMEEAK